MKGLEVDDESDLTDSLFWILVGLTWKGFVKVIRE